MIPKDKVQEANAVKGFEVAFQDGLVRFYDTWVNQDGRDTRITFRAHERRSYVDRYNWFWVYDRLFFGVSSRAVWVRNAPATEDRVLKWMRDHYLIFQTKGFPLDTKWLRQIDWRLYDLQTKNRLEGGEHMPDAKLIWKIDRDTLEVTKV